MDYQAIYNEALLAGQTAEQKWVEQYGEDPYCGFAWVDLPSARTPFVTWCKKNGVGSKHWRKGWQIWRPTGNGTQSMSVLEAGAYAFAEVLTKHGIQAWAGSRPD